MAQALRKFKAAVIVVFSFLLYLMATAHLSRSLSISDTTAVLPYRAAQPHWSPGFFKAISLGHWPVLVDAFWVNVLVDPSIHKVDRRERSPMFYDLYSASELDPGYFDLHFFGGNLLSIIRGDIEGARLLLERAREFQKTERTALGQKFIKHFWPAPFSISISLAYLHLYELDSFEEGAKVLEETVKEPGAPVYLKFLIERLRDPVRASELGIRITRELLARAPNETAKAKYSERLQSLEVAHYVFRLNEIWNSERKAHPFKKFDQFLVENKVPLKDPWGGDLYLNEKNQIETTTPRKKVFGL